MIHEWTHLFFPVDPFLRAAVPDQFETGSFKSKLFFRPVSLVGDLKILYDWFNHPYKAYPGMHSHFRLPLLFHYKAILQSADAQSLLLLESKRPMAQIDLIPAQQDPIHLSYFMGAEEYVVHFFLNNEKSLADREGFVVAFLDGLLRLKNASRLFVSVYAEDIAMREKLVQAEFSECARFAGEGGGMICLMAGGAR